MKFTEVPLLSRFYTMTSLTVLGDFNRYAANLTRMPLRILALVLLAASTGCGPSTTHDNQQPMTNASIDQSVVVSKSSLESDDPYDVVYSNITFVNALQSEHFTQSELSADAMRSYYVDYYLAQVNNGGFSQFVYNTGWEHDTIRCVREGLLGMGANQHYELFNQSATILDRLGPDGLEKFFESEYFGESRERDILNEFDNKFYDLSEREDLVQLNSEWLKGLPNLVVMTVDEMKDEVERRAAALPDREARAAEALANEPRFMKLMRALCAEAGHGFSHATAGDPTHENNGQQTLAWHFITDKGHHYMVDADGKAIMFDGDSNEQIVTIDAPDEYGTD